MMKKSILAALVVILLLGFFMNPWTVKASYLTYVPGRHRVYYDYTMVPRMQNEFPRVFPTVLSKNGIVYDCRSSLRLYPIGIFVVGYCPDNQSTRVTFTWNLVGFNEGNIVLTPMDPRNTIVN